tara:strand:- start:192 stop:512 length:321 start_codon:yes stop_codon:yes gene_type:complete
MKYKTILSKAKDILAMREHTYGDARPLHETIAARWTSVLQDKFKPGEQLTAHEVARLMAELKAARMDCNGFHEDSLIDQINYLVIAYRLQFEANLKALEEDYEDDV